MDLSKKNFNYVWFSCQQSCVKVIHEGLAYFEIRVYHPHRFLNIIELSMSESCFCCAQGWGFFTHCLLKRREITDFKIMLYFISSFSHNI